MRGAQVVAVADPDPDARELAAALTGATPLADSLAAIDRPEVDAVVVCAPNAQHAELALAALDARRHLYVEKPLATDSAAGREVAAAAERAGTAAAVGLAMRFDALYATARAVLRTLGPLHEVSTVWLEPLAGPATPSWKRLRASGGGALLDLGVHHLDLLTWLTGESIAAVDDASLSSERGEHDGAELSATLTGGASFDARFGYDDARRCGWVFAGERGWMAVDRCARRVSVARARERPLARPGLDALRGRLLGLPVVRRERIFGRALRAWVQCANGGPQAPQLATVADGLRALEAVESIEAAAAVPVSA